VHLVAIGGSDAGISAALRASELDPAAEVTVVVADAYPNFSICGIPYYLSGEVDRWQSLAHRTRAGLEAAGMRLRLDTTARRIDVAARKLLVTAADGGEDLIAYDQLVIGTGAVPVRPPIRGLDALGPADGVHLLHTMGDTFAVMRTLTETAPARAVIVGAGYVGLEMADALATRGLQVTQMEQLPEVLATVDPELGTLVHHELGAHGVEVLTGTTGRVIGRNHGSPGRLRIEAVTARGELVTRTADLVLVVSGVRPDTSLAASAGATLGPRGAIMVDRGMRTGLPGVFAAGDCVALPHLVLGEPAWVPLGPAANKTGRVAGTVAAGGTSAFAGVVGTAVMKVFDLEVARTGLSLTEARAAGLDAVATDVTSRSRAKYYPGSSPVHVRLVHAPGGRLLGAQMTGREGAAKRIDVLATALQAGFTVGDLAALDLSYAPPYAPVYDPVLLAANQAVRAAANAGG
jgi:NADPH-dependent 2,4-dienoyl-CoA reductase/sulfur reductase-like enzyme